MKKIMFNDRYCLTKAVLDGRKTMTRRFIIMPYSYTIQHVKTDNGIVYYFQNPNFHKHGMLGGKVVYGFEGLVIPKYKIGEVVAVAQSYKEAKITCLDYLKATNNKGNGYAKGFENKMFVKPELMPHHIRITNVRIERLQDISDEDCLKEGIENIGNMYHVMDSKKNEMEHYSTPFGIYSFLIDKMYGKGTWDSNPYVFVYEFERVTKKIIWKCKNQF